MRRRMKVKNPEKNWSWQNQGRSFLNGIEAIALVQSLNILSLSCPQPSSRAKHLLINSTWLHIHDTKKCAMNNSNKNSCSFPSKKYIIKSLTYENLLPVINLPYLTGLSLFLIIQSNVLYSTSPTHKMEAGSQLYYDECVMNLRASLEKLMKQIRYADLLGWVQQVYQSSVEIHLHYCTECQVCHVLTLCLWMQLQQKSIALGRAVLFTDNQSSMHSSRCYHYAKIVANSF